MARPLSGTYFNEEADLQALPRDVVLERVTPQALLERTKNSLLSNWQEAIPKNFMGQPETHRGPAIPLLDMVTTGQLRKGDETGSVSVSPYGFQITNSPQPNFESGKPIVIDESKIWSLDVGPGRASYSKGDFGIGGTSFGSTKSGYIRKGPVRLEAGYGVVNPYAPSSNVAPIESYTPKEPEFGPEEKWVKLGVEFGTPKEMRGMNVMPELQTKYAVEQAVQPFTAVNASPPPVKTAREEAEEFLKDYKDKNEDWWRP